MRQQLTKWILVWGMCGLGLSAALLPQPEAWARAGGGRSSGSRSGFGRAPSSSSFGGSRDYRAQPSPQGGGFGSPSPSGSQAPYASQFPRSAPPPSSSPVGPAPYAPPAASSSGSFLKGLAGGVAGGFLGSMLFSSLSSHGSASAPALGQGAAVGQPQSPGRGGIGLIEIILIGGLCYLGYRLFRRRRAAQEHMQWASAGGPANGGYVSATEVSPALGPVGSYASTHVSPAFLSEEQVTDFFFRVQGAWTRRDLEPVRSLLEPQMFSVLHSDLENLRRQGHVNRLENIAVRRVSLSEPWQEAGVHYVTVRFTANLLDYVVEEVSQKRISGSDQIPVKFEEDWTFAYAEDGGGHWKLSGIEQVA